ncbi:MAG: endopeptidase La [Candidatus Eisenbacteria sp.]|nr:endopeptidase La [Candidatus Eisenbacteria bacterium]
MDSDSSGEDFEQVLAQPEEISVPGEIGIIPLRDAVIFPHLVAPLVIGRPKSLAVVDEAIAGDRIVGLVVQRNEKEDPSVDDLYPVGTAVLILKMLRFPDDTTRLLVQGVARVRVSEFLQTEPYFKARVIPVTSKREPTVKVRALTRSATGLFNKIVSLTPHLPEELAVAVMNLGDPSRTADLIASSINLSVHERQGILDLADVKKRLEKVYEYLGREEQVLELGSEIQAQVKEEMDKSQREYYLRQQLKAIRKELGEEDEMEAEVREIRSRIEAVGMPEEARKQAETDLERLSRMVPMAAEYSVVRTYLDWLMELPWSKTTEDRLDVRHAQRILDHDHYDLEQVKERILEYLAVRQLKEDQRGSVLCFVGPPGVGKTSLGRSIARALGRKFIGVSLGGIRDEAEIRGHRRTYVGALPGRIIQGIRSAGTSNPLFMLDEIDKMGFDIRGDPTAALLEVLDMEQNHRFSDHYLEVPFDLSRVIFIATANALDTVPPALRDRMEIMELPGYAEEEKLKIARRFLVKRELRAHGLKPKQLQFTDAALGAAIGEYTREAGVRALERRIATVCRKVARQVVGGKKRPVRVGVKNLSKYLGRSRYFREVASHRNISGVAVALAWTEAGGEIMFIESNIVRGDGRVQLTGQLGEVMRESAQAALTFIRSRAEDLNIDDTVLQQCDLHIHVPAGAIAKDGPSAGITIAASVASLLTNTPIDPETAMTGEITLKGRVLPVGGVREKVLGARRAGIRRIILPEHNREDIEEIPREYRKGMTFVFADSVADALSAVLGPKGKRGKRKVKRKQR